MYMRKPRDSRRRNQYARTLLYDRNAVPSFAVSHDELEKWRQYFIKNKIPTYLPPSMEIKFYTSTTSGTLTHASQPIPISTFISDGEIPYKLYVSSLSKTAITAVTYTFSSGVQAQLSGLPSDVVNDPSLVVNLCPGLQEPFSMVIDYSGSLKDLLYVIRSATSTPNDTIQFTLRPEVQSYDLVVNVFTIRLG